jgi:acetoin:2,6-dichlorophenolindophenol oxidoreductase subunit beta
MPELTYADAVRDGLAEEMRRDRLVWALGEDLSRAHTSTSSTQYKDLIDEFGAKRICDTPISESTIMGAAVGAAVAGTRPVADLRGIDFGLVAIDELVNQAAKIRYMFGGQARVPLVVREAIGTRRGAAAQHSQSLEAWFVHVPGLVVVTPATPADGKGLLKSAIRCDDPVVFMEHKELWTVKGEVPDGEHLVPLGVARLVRKGTDITIVAWSRMSLLAAKAAETLADDGISAEVIDLRTIWPWDRAAVLTSAKKTGRLLVPQEAVQAGGFAAEVAMEIVEALPGLNVKRIGAPRIPVPYAPPLEDAYRVTDADIVAAARGMCG